MYSIYDNGLHYDLMYPVKQEDIDFWIDLAEESPNRTILELGCGTGRFSVPMAEAGFQVAGIDLSGTMMDQAGRKAESEGVELSLIKADMKNFELGKKFGFIFIPSNTIVHLLTRSDVEACLSCIRKHLADDGFFAFSVFVPTPDKLKRKSVEEQEWAVYQDPESGEDIRVMFTYEYEYDTQIKRITTYHYFPGNEEPVIGKIDLKMYFPQEVDALLEYNGFRIVNKWGSMKRESFGHDSDMQFIRTKIGE